MIDDELVLRVERLRDLLEEFKSTLKGRYRRKTAPVGRSDLQETAAQLAERWLVEVANRDDVRIALTDDVLADLNIEFQRMLTYSERSTQRGKYDATVSAILSDFRGRVIVPLKRNRGVLLPKRPGNQSFASGNQSLWDATSAFVGQSFAEEDAVVNEPIKRFLRVYGLDVLTGEKPVADRVSAKVRTRIEQSNLFVGIFTRRDRLAGSAEWATSAWIIDEKAYALAKNKPLILLKERGVQSIGGLQGDYEYLEFERDKLEDLLIRLLEILKS